MNHVEQRVVNENRLHHHRRSAEYRDIDIRDYIKKLLPEARTCACREIQFHSAEAADDQAENQAESGAGQSDEERCPYAD